MSEGKVFISTDDEGVTYINFQDPHISNEIACIWVYNGEGRIANTSEHIGEEEQQEPFCTITELVEVLLEVAKRRKK